MKMYKLLVLLVVLVYCYEVESQLFGGQYGSRGGLLSGFGSLSGSIEVPSVSSGLKTIAGGVRDILSTTKDTVEKLVPPIAVEFSAQIGASGGNENRAEYVPKNSNVNDAQTGQFNRYEDNGAQVDQFNRKENLRSEYNPGESNQNSQRTPGSYPNYEISNQNNHDRFNGAQTSIDNSHKNSQQRNDEGVVMYIDNNFPVILLKENEIRR